jgi:hypothetical protein
MEGPNIINVVEMGGGFSTGEHPLLLTKRSIAADLLAFFHDRLKVYLRDKGARHDLIDAVLAGGAAPSSPLAGEVSAEPTEGGGSASSVVQAAPPPPGPSGHPPRKGEGDVLTPQPSIPYDVDRFALDDALLCPAGRGEPRVSPVPSDPPRGGRSARHRPRPPPPLRGGVGGADGGGWFRFVGRAGGTTPTRPCGPTLPARGRVPAPTTTS